MRDYKASFNEDLRSAQNGDISPPNGFTNDPSYNQSRNVSA
jgi:hypothetical protein